MIESIHDLTPLIERETVMSTPGPWIQHGLLVSDAQGRHVAYCTRWERGTQPAIAAANARLIAAAPDLLNTLQTLAYRLRVDGRTADGITKEAAATLCDAAIAKAEGR